MKNTIYKSLIYLKRKSQFSTSNKSNFRIFAILLFLLFSSSISYGQKVKRDPQQRKDIANVYYKQKYTLFDLWSDQPIFPDESGIYNIYVASNENKVPREFSGNAIQLENMTVYKFKNFNNCKNWCDGKIFDGKETNDNQLTDIKVHLNSSYENFKKKAYTSTINDCNKIIELYNNNPKSLKPLIITNETEYQNTYFEGTGFHNSYELYCWIIQLRGTCEYYLNDFNVAITDLEKAIELNTNIKSLFGSSDWRISSCFSWNSDCNLLIGQSYLKQKDFSKSILYFNKAIEINGLNLKSFNFRGIAKLFLNDYTGAMSDFNFVINRKSHSLVTAHIARGYLNSLLANNSGSCEDINLAIQISKSKDWLITEFDNTLLDFPEFNKAIDNCKNNVQSNKIANSDIINEPVPITFIKIGNLEWSTNNLDVTQFRNGDPILFVKNESEMVSAAKSKTPAYSIDPFSGTKLYNWYAVNDSRGLAPQGCKLTKYDDFANLFESVKNNKKDLMKMGAWGQIKATDNFGFSAIPNNYFIFNGSSQSAKYGGGVSSYFWLSDVEINNLPLKSEKDFDPAHARMVLNSFLDDYWTFDKGSMLAVRCIKGESNFYKGEMANGQPNGLGELFIEEIESYLGTENNRVQLSKGQSYIGLWKNGVPHGEGYIKWYDFPSKSYKKDSTLFYEGKYFGYWQYNDNKIHKCLECGVKNTKCTLKTPEQIKLSKEMAFNGLISWHPSIDKYKCESYCSSTCELKAKQKAELAMKQRQQEIESSNYSNTNNRPLNAGDCHTCKGTGKCQECTNKIDKPYIDERCAQKKRSEVNFGYVKCEQCHGYGYKIEYNKNKCDCPGGFGDCPGEKCYISSCNDGWVYCRECNSGGNGNHLGECKECKGTGKEK